jgi:hypothetical protein
MVAGGVRQDVLHSDAPARKKAAATQTRIFNLRPRLTSGSTSSVATLRGSCKATLSEAPRRRCLAPSEASEPGPATSSRMTSYSEARRASCGPAHFPDSRQRAAATLTPACRAGLGASHGREMLYDDKPVDLALQEGVQERRVVMERHAAI